MADEIELSVHLDNKQALMSLTELEVKAGEMSEQVQQMQTGLDTQLPGYAEGMTTQYALFQNNLQHVLDLRRQIDAAGNSFDAQQLTASFTKAFSTVQKVYQDFVENFNLSTDISSKLSAMQDDVKTNLITSIKKIQPQFVGELRRFAAETTKAVGSQTDDALVNMFVGSAQFRQFTQRLAEEIKPFGGTEEAAQHNLKTIAKISLPYAVAQYHRNKIIDWREDEKGPETFREMLPSRFQSIPAYIKNATIRQRNQRQADAELLSEKEFEALQNVVTSNTYALDAAVAQGVARKYNGRIFLNDHITREMVNAMAGTVMHDIVNGAQGERRYGITDVEDPNIFYKIIRKNNKMLLGSLDTARAMNDQFAWLDPGYYAPPQTAFTSGGRSVKGERGKIRFDPRINTRAYAEYTLDEMKRGAQFDGEAVGVEGREARPEDYHMVTLRDSIHQRKLRATNAGDNVEHNGFSRNAIYLKTPEEAFDYETSDDRLKQIKEDLAYRLREGYTVNGRHYSYVRHNSTRAEFILDDIIRELGGGDFDAGRRVFLNGASQTYTDPTKFHKALDYQNKTATDSQRVTDLYGSDFSKAVVVVSDMKKLGMDGFNIISNSVVPASFQGRENEAAEKATYVAASFEGLRKLYADKIDAQGNLVIPGAAPGGKDLVVPPNVTMIEDVSNIKNFDTRYAGKSLEEINADRSAVLQRGDLSAKVTYEGAQTESRWLSHQAVQALGHGFTPEIKQYFNQVLFDELASLGDDETVKRKLFGGRDVDLTSASAQQTIQDYTDMIFQRIGQGDLLLPEGGMQYGMAAPWLPNIFNKAFSTEAAKQAGIQLTEEQKQAAIDENNVVFTKILADTLGILRAPYSSEGNIVATNEGNTEKFKNFVKILGLDPNGLYMAPGSAIMSMMQTEDFDGDINAILNLDKQGVGKQDSRYVAAMNHLMLKAREWQQENIINKSGRSQEQQDDLKQKRTRATQEYEGHIYDMFDPTINAEEMIEGAKAGAKMGLANAVDRNAWQYGVSKRVARAHRDAASHYDAVSTWLKERNDFELTPDEKAILGGGAPFAAMMKWAADALETVEGGQEWTAKSQEAFNKRNIDTVNLPSKNQGDILSMLYSRFEAKQRGYDINGKMNWDQIFANLPEVDTSTATGKMTQQLRNIRRDMLKGDYFALSDELEQETKTLAAAAYAEIERDVRGDSSFKNSKERNAEIMRRYREAGGYVAANIGKFVVTQQDAREDSALDMEIKQIMDLSGGASPFGSSYGSLYDEPEKIVQQKEKEIAETTKRIQEREARIQEIKLKAKRRMMTTDESVKYDEQRSKEVAVAEAESLLKGEGASAEEIKKEIDFISNVYDAVEKGELIVHRHMQGIGGQPDEHTYKIKENGQWRNLTQEEINAVTNLQQLETENAADQSQLVSLNREKASAEDQITAAYAFIKAQERFNGLRSDIGQFQSGLFSSINRKERNIDDIPEAQAYYEHQKSMASRFQYQLDAFRESKEFDSLSEADQDLVNKWLSDDKGLLALVDTDFADTTELKAKQLFERFQKANKKHEGPKAALDERFQSYDDSLKKIIEYRDLLEQNIATVVDEDKKDELVKRLDATNKYVEQAQQESDRLKASDLAKFNEQQRHQRKQQELHLQQQEMQASQFAMRQDQTLYNWNIRGSNDIFTRANTQRFGMYNQLISQRQHANIEIARLEEQKRQAEFVINDPQASSDAVASAKASFASATLSIETYKQKLSEANNALQQFGKDGQFSNNMNAVKASLESVAQAADRLIQRFGRQLFQRMFKEAKTFVTQFSTQMQTIQAITLKTDEEMTQVRNDTIDRAIRLKTNVSNVSTVEADLYRQGLSDDQVNERADAIIKFATVTGAKVTDAGKAITTAIQNGLVSSAEEAMDVLTALGDTAATTANEIFKGMQKSAAAAKVAGVSYNELTTLLTIGTSKTQLSGQVIGTGLQTIFSRMNRVTNEGYYNDENGITTTINDVEKALQSAGVELREENNKDSFRNSFDVLRDLSKVWNTLSDIQKSNITYSMAGGRQTNMFQSLMEGMAEDGGAELERILGVAQNSEGTTDNKFAQSVRSITAAMNELQSTYDGLIASIADDRAFVGVIDGLSGIVAGLKGFSDAGQSSVAVFGIIGTAIMAFAMKTIFASEAISGALGGWAGLFKTVVVAGTAIAGAKILSDSGKAAKANYEANDDELQKQKRIDAAKESYETRKDQLSPIQKQIDNVEDLGKAWEKSGKKMAGKEYDALQSSLTGLNDALGSTSEAFDTNATAVENWKKVVSGAQASVDSISLTAAYAADIAADAGMVEEFRKLYEEHSDVLDIVNENKGIDKEALVKTLGDESLLNLFDTQLDKNQNYDAQARYDRMYRAAGQKGNKLLKSLMRDHLSNTGIRNFFEEESVDLFRGLLTSYDLGTMFQHFEKGMTDGFDFEKDENLRLYRTLVESLLKAPNSPYAFELAKADIPMIDETHVDWDKIAKNPNLYQGFGILPFEFLESAAMKNSINDIVYSTRIKGIAENRLANSNQLNYLFKGNTDYIKKAIAQEMQTFNTSLTGEELSNAVMIARQNIVDRYNGVNEKWLDRTMNPENYKSQITYTEKSGKKITFGYDGYLQKDEEGNIDQKQLWSIIDEYIAEGRDKEPIESIDSNVSGILNAAQTISTTLGQIKNPEFKFDVIINMNKDGAIDSVDVDANSSSEGTQPTVSTETVNTETSTETEPAAGASTQSGAPADIIAKRNKHRTYGRLANLDPNNITLSSENILSEEDFDNLYDVILPKYSHEFASTYNLGLSHVAGEIDDNTLRYENYFNIVHAIENVIEDYDERQAFIQEAFENVDALDEYLEYTNQKLEEVDNNIDTHTTTSGPDASSVTPTHFSSIDYSKGFETKPVENRTDYDDRLGQLNLLVNDMESLGFIPGNTTLSGVPEQYRKQVRSMLDYYYAEEEVLDEWYQKNVGEGIDPLTGLLNTAVGATNWASGMVGSALISIPENINLFFKGLAGLPEQITPAMMNYIADFMPDEYKNVTSALGRWGAAAAHTPIDDYFENSAAGFKLVHDKINEGKQSGINEMMFNTEQLFSPDVASVVGTAANVATPGIENAISLYASLLLGNLTSGVQNIDLRAVGDAMSTIWSGAKNIFKTFGDAVRSSMSNAQFKPMVMKEWADSIADVSKQGKAPSLLDYGKTFMDAFWDSILEFTDGGILGGGEEFIPAAGKALTRFEKFMEYSHKHFPFFATFWEELGQEISQDTFQKSTDNLIAVATGEKAAPIFGFNQGATFDPYDLGKTFINTFISTGVFRGIGKAFGHSEVTSEKEQGLYPTSSVETVNALNEESALKRIDEYRQILQSGDWNGRSSKDIYKMKALMYYYDSYWQKKYNTSLFSESDFAQTDYQAARTSYEEAKAIRDDMLKKQENGTAYTIDEWKAINETIMYREADMYRTMAENGQLTSMPIDELKDVYKNMMNANDYFNTNYGEALYDSEETKQVRLTLLEKLREIRREKQQYEAQVATEEQQQITQNESIAAAEAQQAEAQRKAQKKQENQEKKEKAEAAAESLAEKEQAKNDQGQQQKQGTFDAEINGQKISQMSYMQLLYLSKKAKSGGYNAEISNAIINELESRDLTNLTPEERKAISEYADKHKKELTNKTRMNIDNAINAEPGGAKNNITPELPQGRVDQVPQMQPDVGEPTYQQGFTPSQEEAGPPVAEQSVEESLSEKRQKMSPAQYVAAVGQYIRWSNGQEAPPSVVDPEGFINDLGADLEKYDLSRLSERQRKAITDLINDGDNALWFSNWFANKVADNGGTKGVPTETPTEQTQNQPNEINAEGAPKPTTIRELTQGLNIEMPIAQEVPDYYKVDTYSKLMDMISNYYAKGNQPATQKSYADYADTRNAIEGFDYMSLTPEEFSNVMARLNGHSQVFSSKFRTYIGSINQAVQQSQGTQTVTASETTPGTNVAESTQGTNTATGETNPESTTVVRNNDGTYAIYDPATGKWTHVSPENINQLQNGNNINGINVTQTVNTKKRVSPLRAVKSGIKTAAGFLAVEFAKGIYGSTLGGGGNGGPGEDDDKIHLPAAATGTGSRKDNTPPESPSPSSGSSGSSTPPPDQSGKSDDADKTKGASATSTPPKALSQIISDATDNAKKQDLTDTYGLLLQYANGKTNYNDLEKELLSKNIDSKIFQGLFTGNEKLRQLATKAKETNYEADYTSFIEELQQAYYGYTLLSRVPKIAENTYSYNKTQTAIDAIASGKATSEQYQMIAQQYGIDEYTMRSTQGRQAYLALAQHQNANTKSVLEQNAAEDIQNTIDIYAKGITDEKKREAFYENVRNSGDIRTWIEENVVGKEPENAQAQALLDVLNAYANTGYTYTMDENNNIKATLTPSAVHQEDLLNPDAWNRSAGRTQIRSDIMNYINNKGQLVGVPESERDKRIEAMKQYSSELAEYISLTDDARTSLEGLRLLEKIRISVAIDGLDDLEALGQMSQEAVTWAKQLSTGGTLKFEAYKGMRSEGYNRQQLIGIANETNRTKAMDQAIMQLVGISADNEDEYYSNQAKYYQEYLNTINSEEYRTSLSNDYTAAYRKTSSKEERQRVVEAAQRLGGTVHAAANPDDVKITFDDGYYNNVHYSRQNPFNANGDTFYSPRQVSNAAHGIMLNINNGMDVASATAQYADYLEEVKSSYPELYEWMHTTDVNRKKDLETNIKLKFSTENFEEVQKAGAAIEDIASLLEEISKGGIKGFNAEKTLESEIDEANYNAYLLNELKTKGFAGITNESDKQTILSLSGNSDKTSEWVANNGEQITTDFERFEYENMQQIFREFSTSLSDPNATEFSKNIMKNFMQTYGTVGALGIYNAPTLNEESAWYQNSPYMPNDLSKRYETYYTESEEADAVKELIGLRNSAGISGTVNGFKYATDTHMTQQLQSLLGQDVWDTLYNGAETQDAIDVAIKQAQRIVGMRQYQLAQSIGTISETQLSTLESMIYGTTEQQNESILAYEKEYDELRQDIGAFNSVTAGSPSEITDRLQQIAGMTTWDFEDYKANYKDQVEQLLQARFNQAYSTYMFATDAGVNFGDKNFDFSSFDNIGFKRNNPYSNLMTYYSDQDIGYLILDLLQNDKLNKDILNDQSAGSLSGQNRAIYEEAINRGYGDLLQNYIAEADNKDELYKQIYSSIYTKDQERGLVLPSMADWMSSLQINGADVGDTVFDIYKAAQNFSNLVSVTNELTDIVAEGKDIGDFNDLRSNIESLGYTVDSDNVNTILNILLAQRSKEANQWSSSIGDLMPQLKGNDLYDSIMQTLGLEEDDQGNVVFAEDFYTNMPDNRKRFWTTTGTQWTTAAKRQAQLDILNADSIMSIDELNRQYDGLLETDSELRAFRQMMANADQWEAQGVMGQDLREEYNNILKRIRGEEYTQYANLGLITSEQQGWLNGFVGTSTDIETTISSIDKYRELIQQMSDVNGLTYLEMLQKEGYKSAIASFIGVDEKDIASENWTDVQELVKKRLTTQVNTLPYFFKSLFETDAGKEAAKSLAEAFNIELDENGNITDEGALQNIFNGLNYAWKRNLTTENIYSNAQQRSMTQTILNRNMTLAEAERIYGTQLSQASDLVKYLQLKELQSTNPANVDEQELKEAKERAESAYTTNPMVSYKRNRIFSELAPYISDIMTNGRSAFDSISDTDLQQQLMNVTGLADYMDTFGQKTDAAGEAQRRLARTILTETVSALEQEGKVMSGLSGQLETIQFGNILDSTKQMNQLASDMQNLAETQAAYQRLISGQTTNMNDWNLMQSMFGISDENMKKYMSGERSLQTDYQNVMSKFTDFRNKNATAIAEDIIFKDAGSEAYTEEYNPSFWRRVTDFFGFTKRETETKRKSVAEYLKSKNATPEEINKINEELRPYGIKLDENYNPVAIDAEKPFTAGQTLNQNLAIREKTGQSDHSAEYGVMLNFWKAAGGNQKQFMRGIQNARNKGLISESVLSDFLNNEEVLSAFETGNEDVISGLLFRNAYGVEEYNATQMSDVQDYIKAALTGNKAKLEELKNNDKLRNYLLNNVSGFSEAYSAGLSGVALNQAQIDALTGGSVYQSLLEREQAGELQKGTAQLGQTLASGTEEEKRSALNQYASQMRQVSTAQDALSTMIADSEHITDTQWEALTASGKVTNEQVEYYKQHVDELDDLSALLKSSENDISQSMKAAILSAFNLEDLSDLSKEGNKEINTLVREMLKIHGLEIENNEIVASKESRSSSDIFGYVSNVSGYVSAQTVRSRANEFANWIKESKDLESFENRLNEMSGVEGYKWLTQENEVKAVLSRLGMLEETYARGTTGNMSWAEFQQAALGGSDYSMLTTNDQYYRNLDIAKSLFGEDFLSGNYNLDMDAIMSSMQSDEYKEFWNWFTQLDESNEFLETLTENTERAEIAERNLSSAMLREGVKASRAYGDATEEVAKNVEELTKDSKTAHNAVRNMATQLSAVQKNQFYRQKYRSGDRSSETVSAIAGMTGLTEEDVKKGGSLVEKMLANAEDDDMRAVQTWADTITTLMTEQLFNKSSEELSSLGVDAGVIDVIANGGSVNIDMSEIEAKLGSAVDAELLGMMQMLSAKGFQYHIEAEGGEKGAVKVVIDGLGKGSKGGGGGGGGGGKSAAQKLMEELKREQQLRSHEIKMIQYQETKYENAGELGNQIRMIDLENGAQKRLIATLETAIKRTKEQMAQTKKGSDDWYSLYDSILQYEEGIEEATQAYDDNIRKMQELEQAILKLHTDLEDTVNQEIEARKQRERDMLAGSVSMQDIIVEAIRQRYRDEWDLIKKDIEKKKQALEEEKNLIDERLQRRKDAEDEAEKYEELSEYKRQLALIQMDSTRTKDAAKLREKIAEIEKDISWDVAEDEATYQKEQRDDQIQAFEDFIAYGDEDLESWLSDANHFADEVNSVLKMSQDAMMQWLKDNVQEYALAMDDAQKQMVQGWTDTYDQMLGITHTYWKEIAEILSGKELFLSYMEESQEYIHASEDEQKQMLYQWGDMYDKWVLAQKRDAVYSHSDEALSGTGQTEKKGGGGSPKPKTDLLPSEVPATDALPEGYTAPKKTSLQSQVGDLGGQQTSDSPDGDIARQKDVWTTISDTIDRAWSYLFHYDNGGLVNYTGPAWVDGTPSRPEAFLDAEDTATLRGFLDEARYVRYRSTVSNIDSNSFNGNSQNIGELVINITEAQFKDDADFDEVAKRVGQQFVKELSKQGFHTTSYSF